MTDLISLAERVERATGPSKALNREIALAIGWVRLSPSEARRKHPAWFHPDDCRDGKVIFDSLHGTDVWREPSDYTGSIDAAMTLVPEGAAWGCGFGVDPSDDNETGWAWSGNHIIPDVGTYRWAATPALALVAASLRAIASEVSK